MLHDRNQTQSSTIDVQGLAGMAGMCKGWPGWPGWSGWPGGRTDAHWQPWHLPCAAVQPQPIHCQPMCNATTHQPSHCQALQHKHCQLFARACLPAPLAGHPCANTADCQGAGRLPSRCRMQPREDTSIATEDAPPLVHVLPRADLGGHVHLQVVPPPTREVALQFGKRLHPQK